MEHKRPTSWRHQRYVCRHWWRWSYGLLLSAERLSQSTVRSHLSQRSWRCRQGHWIPLWLLLILAPPPRLSRFRVDGESILVCCLLHAVGQCHRRRKRLKTGRAFSPHFHLYGPFWPIGAKKWAGNGPPCCLPCPDVYGQCGRVSLAGSAGSE